MAESRRSFWASEDSWSEIAESGIACLILASKLSAFKKFQGWKNEEFDSSLRAKDEMMNEIILVDDMIIQRWLGWEKEKSAGAEAHIA